MGRGIEAGAAGLSVLIVGLLMVSSAAAAHPTGAPRPSTVPATPPSWTMLTPATGSPGARDQSSMAYDPARGSVILFGGYNYASFDYNDTWSFHAGIWTDLTPNLTVNPPARWSPSLAYDPALKGLILFGGRTFSTYYNDTWLFNATGWHQLSPRIAPAARSAAGMTYDPALHEMILYGGWIGNVVGHSTPTYFSDTWAFKGGQWRNLTAHLKTNPGARFGPQLSFDPKLNALIAFSGDLVYPNGTGSWVNSTWSLTARGWAAVPTAHAPPVGGEPGGLTYYTGCKCLVQFGAGRAAPYGNQTWVFEKGGWKNQTAKLSSAPSARGFGLMADDLSDGYVVLFGGDPGTGNSYASDTWVYR